MIRDINNNISKINPSLKSYLKKDKKIIIKNLDSNFYIRIDEIMRLEGEGNYTHFYLFTGEHFLSSKGLKSYKSILQYSNFLQIHQSHILHIDAVRQWRKKDHKLILINGEEIPISRRNKALVIKWLE